MGRPPFNPGTTERSHQTPRAGRYVAGIGRQLRPQHIHHAPRHPRGLTDILIGRSPAGLETLHANDSREGRPISDGTTSKA
jgi:hypothetical protein